jgi:hypothetical protein
MVRDLYQNHRSKDCKSIRKTANHRVFDLKHPMNSIAMDAVDSDHEVRVEMTLLSSSLYRSFP